MSTYFTDRAQRRPLGTPVRPAGSGGGTAGPPGPTGPAGATGPVGPGVAPGGTTGQVLAKTSAVDYATGWTTPATVPPPVAMGATAPASPVVGQLWWRSTDGNLYVYYNDGTSTQWVPAMASVGLLTPPVVPGPPLVMSDTFESYPTTGIFAPAPWVNSTNTVILSTPVHTGTRSLGIGQGGLACNAQLPLGASLTKWTLDCWLQVNSVGDTTGQYIGLCLGAAPGLIVNVSNVGAGRVLKDGGAVLFTFSASTNVWQHYILTVVQHATTGTVSLTVDGTSMGTFAGDTRDTAGNTTVDRVYVVGAFIGPSPTGEIYLDDLYVYNNA